MSCITLCIPARIERKSAIRSMLSAAVRNVAYAGSVPPVTVGVFMALGVPNPVPAFDAPTIPHQSQQGFLGGSQAGEKEVCGMKGLAVAAAGCRHLHDPAGTDPVLSDVLRSGYRLAEAFGYGPQDQMMLRLWLLS